MGTKPHLIVAVMVRLNVALRVSWWSTISLSFSELLFVAHHASRCRSSYTAVAATIPAGAAAPAAGRRASA